MSGFIRHYPEQDISVVMLSNRETGNLCRKLTVSWFRERLVENSAITVKAYMTKIRVILLSSNLMPL